MVTRNYQHLFTQCNIFSSPRWLYAHGKPEKARNLLAKLHSETGDINSPLVDLEVEEIEEKIALDGADSTEISFKQRNNIINNIQNGSGISDLCSGERATECGLVLS